MLVQNLNRIASRQNVRQGLILYCATNCIPIDLLTWCLKKTFLLTHKFGAARAIEMTADREEWSELPIGATTATHTRSGTSVIRRSSVPPRAWVGPTTNWSQPDSCEVKGCITMTICGCRTQPLLMMAIESLTSRKEASTSSACTAAIYVSRQSKIRLSRSGLR